MIVDPSTGLPMETGNPATISGKYGAALGQEAGVSSPFFYDAMNSIPSATVTTAWNMRRVSNTIINNKTARYGSNSAGLRQTFSPFRFNSLGKVENIDPDLSRSVRTRWGNREARVGYSPFNFLSKMGNAPFREGTRSNRLIGGRLHLQGRMNALSGASGPLTGGERMFNPGMLGRMAAGGRAYHSVDKAGDILTAVSRIDASSSIRAGKVLDAGPQLAHIRAGAINGYGGLARAAIPGGVDEGQVLKSAIGRTNTGIISGRATGWVHGAEAFGRGEDALQTARMMGVGAKNYSVGVEAGARFAQNSRVLGRVAASGAISGAARVAGPIGTALLVRDLTMFAGRSIGRTIKLGIEATQSATGNLSKSPFGMGYKDNSVAATSRQRGVMAISNSRLNARSFLGQEAASLFQQFG